MYLICRFYSVFMVCIYKFIACLLMYMKLDILENSLKIYNKKSNNKFMLFVAAHNYNLKSVIFHMYICKYTQDA